MSPHSTGSSLDLKSVAKLSRHQNGRDVKCHSRRDNLTSEHPPATIAADESFLTAAEVVPEVSLDGHPSGDGNPGDMVRELLARLYILTSCLTPVVSAVRPKGYPDMADEIRKSTCVPAEVASDACEKISKTRQYCVNGVDASSDAERTVVNTPGTAVEAVAQSKRQGIIPSVVSSTFAMCLESCRTKLVK